MSGETPDQSERQAAIIQSIESQRPSIQVPEVVVLIEQDHYIAGAPPEEVKERLNNLMAQSGSTVGKVLYRRPDGTEEMQAIIYKEIPKVDM